MLLDWKLIPLKPGKIYLSVFPKFLTLRQNLLEGRNVFNSHIHITDEFNIISRIYLINFLRKIVFHLVGYYFRTKNYFRLTNQNQTLL